MIEVSLEINETFHFKINEKCKNGASIYHTATHILCICLKGTKFPKKIFELLIINSDLILILKCI